MYLIFFLMNLLFILIKLLSFAMFTIFSQGYRIIVYLVPCGPIIYINTPFLTLKHLLKIHYCGIIVE